MEQIISKVLGEFEQGRMSRRMLVQTLTVAVAASAGGAPTLAAETKAAAKAGGFKAMAVNYISYGVADYARTRDFYADLLGMKVTHDDGKQCYLEFGDSMIVARKTKQPDNKPYIDHVAYTIDNWNTDAVKAELTRRGLNPGNPAGESFIIKDPDGFSVQISSKTG